MQNQDNFFPQDLYLGNLSTIKGINFTRREIDIMACLVGARGTSKIASLLSIAPKTVANHIHNIMVKMDCNSREAIIDFVERSKKLPLLRQYYIDLTVQADFNKKLKEVSRFVKIDHTSFKISYLKESAFSKKLADLLEIHFKCLGLNASAESHEKEVPLACFLTEPVSQEYAIYILSTEEESAIDFLERASESSEEKNFTNTLFILLGDESLPYAFEIPGLNYVKVTRESNYYSSFFDVLQRVFPNPNLEKLRNDFINQHDLSTPLSESIFIQTETENTEITEEKRETSHSLAKWTYLFSRKASFFIICAVSLGVLAIIYLSFKLQPEELIAHSDLILPHEATLLQRPELIREIQQKLKNQKGIQTIALIGIGGAGKTTLAREYAHSQKSPVVWEVNAESRGSIKASFENLAQSLAKTEEEKKILNAFEEIKDVEQKEKQLIQFVKDHLKTSQPWILIYDNVDSMSEIASYFPASVNTWGAGQVIVTTRDHTLRINKHIQDALNIDELSEEQKLTLFKMIMYGDKKPIPSSDGEIKAFLREIPSFPLDVSVAAYYLKITELPLRSYVERINSLPKNFEEMQKKVLKQVGNYMETRSSIIILALKDLVKVHPEFEDLLFFISLIDSQNIPRNLLEAYKDKITVDSLIYHLKRYSLITDESLLPFLQTFSLHRSTQKIFLAYLQDSIVTQKKLEIASNITNTMGKFISDNIEKADILTLKFLTNHLENILLQSDALLPLNKGRISGELGGIYFYLGNYKDAQIFLEKSLAFLNISSAVAPAELAKIFERLGAVNREFGKYEQAVMLLEKSLSLYDEDPSNNQLNIARLLAYLGNAYRNLGKVEIARNFLEKSLEIHREYFPERYTNISQILGYLGLIHWILGNYQKAKDLEEEAYKIYLTRCAHNEIGIARFLTYLAKTYTELGELTKAQDLAKKSVELYHKHYGGEHIDTAWALLHLGNVYKEQGNYTKAKQTLEKTLEIYKKHYKPNHIDVAWVSTYLGSTYSYLGEHTKALSLLENSKKMYESIFGEKHIDTAWVLTILAKSYLLKKSLPEAELYARQAFHIFRENKHPEAYAPLEVLGELYTVLSIQEKSDLKKSQTLKCQANKFYQGSVEILKNNLSSNSPHIIRIQTKINSLPNN